MAGGRALNRIKGSKRGRTAGLIGLGALVAAALWGCARGEAGVADTIYYGGPVITMDDVRPEAKALAVLDGKIAAVGSKREVMRWRGPETQMRDLDGKALLPGFIDAHGHLSFVAQQVALANVASPPVGPVKNFEDLKRELLAYRDANRIPAGQWIVGAGYDDSLLDEGRHPTRDELDAITTEHPILLVHVSAHLAAMNSSGLAAVGIGVDTPDPAGGVIRRRGDRNEPDGVLEESAMMLALSRLPQPAEELQLALLDAAQALYARNGITTAQDGLTRPQDLKLLRRAAAEGRLMMDVVCYPGWFAAGQMMKDVRVGEYENRLKVGGVKLVLDGSPQGKTAYLSRPYHVPPPGKEADYRGYPAMPDAQVEKLVDLYFANGWPVLAHCNGDAAAEQLIRAVDKADAAHPQAEGTTPRRRTVMIHAQMVRDDQLDRMARLGIMPSFFSAHAFYWGDWHRDSVMGPERAARLSPARSAIERGIPFTIHNDAPVVPPDVMLLIWAAVNRETRSGQTLGPEQRLTAAEAIRAVTRDAAYQYFEEDAKGSLEVGKAADLVILSEDPLKADPKALKDIEVEETVSAGKSIFRKEQNSGVQGGAEN